MVRNQGGDPDAILDPKFVETKYVVNVEAEFDGFIASFDTLQVGLAASILGAGRAKADDLIDHKVGIIVLKKVGQLVRKGEPVFEVRGNDLERMRMAIEMLKTSFELTSKEPTESQPLVFEVIE